jgi:hypothetical protein
MSDKREAHRSAASGRFVSKAEADANPNETVRETIRTGRVDPEEMFQDLSDALGQTTLLRGVIAILIERGWRKH